MEGHAVYAQALGEDAGPAHDKRNIEGAIVDAVVVEPALVVVEGLAMVGVDDNQRVLGDSELIEAGEDALHGGVHIGNGAVVLGGDVLGVGDARRHPAGEVVPERRELLDGLHGLVLRVELIARVEHALKGRGREVGAVGVHVAQEQEEGVVLAGEPVEFGNGDVVEVVGLEAWAVLPVAPAREIDVVVEAAGGRVALEADASALVALLLEDLGEGHHAGGEGAAVPERDDVGPKAVHAREHRAVARRGGYVGAEVVLEEDAFFGELVDVGRREAVVPVAAHVVGAKTVDADQ